MNASTTTRRAATLAVFSSILLGSLSGTSTAAPVEATAKPAAGKVRACNGTFKHSVSTIKFDRLPNGRLSWSFKLTAKAKREWGKLVTVTMPQAYVSGYQINPPYDTHTRTSDYDFHASMVKYQRLGKKWKGRNFTIKTNDEVTFLWLIKSISHPKKGGYRTVTCKVPSH